MSLLTSHHTPTHHTPHASHTHHSGAFSVVSKCVQRTTGATFAAKCVSFSLGEEVVMQQFQIHQQSTHTRIVALVESFETDRDITMILE